MNRVRYQSDQVRDFILHRVPVLFCHILWGTFSCGAPRDVVPPGNRQTGGEGGFDSGGSQLRTSVIDA